MINGWISVGKSKSGSKTLFLGSAAAPKTIVFSSIFLSVISATITVMLSGPPCSKAFSIKAETAPTDSNEFIIFNISVSLTTFVKPSLQSNTLSPADTSKLFTSGTKSPDPSIACKSKDLCG